MSVDCTGRAVTRTPETKEDYREVYMTLRAQAAWETGCGPNDSVLYQWYVAQNRRWRASTIRLYRAALVFAIEATCEARKITRGEAAQVLHDVITMPEPLPKGTGPRRTATRKRKTMTGEEVQALARELRKGDELDRLVASFLIINLSLSLRPGEYKGAALEGTLLTVRNGKATNGRGHGATKPINVPSATADHPDFPHALQSFLDDLDAHRTQAGGDGKLWSRLATRLARACERLSIPRVSPYTTRHVALATAKQVMSPEEVAALAGHRTNATAMTHYARRRSGLSHMITVARPAADAVRRVISSPKESRETNIDHQRAQITAAPASHPRDGGADLHQSSALSAAQFRP